MSIKKNLNSKKSIANYYEATRLTFKRNFIEPLKKDEKFSIYLSTTKETFTMSKQDFYDVFSKVVSSDSYLIKGVYSYPKTPQKTYQFLTKNVTHIKQEAKTNLNFEKSSQKEKIGKYVRERIRLLYEEGLINNEEILRLQSPEYSKQNFNSTFEILRKTTRERNDNLGYSRYYKNEIISGYWLSSQWYEPQRKLFEIWEKQLRKVK